MPVSQVPPSTSPNPWRQSEAPTHHIGSPRDVGPPVPRDGYRAVEWCSKDGGCEKRTKSKQKQLRFPRGKRTHHDPVLLDLHGEKKQQTGNDSLTLPSAPCLLQRHDSAFWGSCRERFLDRRVCMIKVRQSTSESGLVGTKSPGGQCAVQVE